MVLIMEHDIRDEIIRKLMHNPGLGFNELWDKDDVRSNKFAYHLKLMSEADIVEKVENKYYLSSRGKSLAVFIDGETGKKEKQPLINIVMVIYDNDNNILLHHRLKEPFYGYYGFPGAKVKFGEGILECAARELMEESNLEADFKIAGIMNLHTYNNGELAYHHTQFVVKCTNPRGVLKKEDREGTLEWASKDIVLSKKLFSDNPFMIESIEDGRFFIAEIDRFQEDHEFGEIKIKSLVKY